MSERTVSAQLTAGWLNALNGAIQAYVVPSSVRVTTWTVRFGDDSTADVPAGSVEPVRPDDDAHVRARPVRRRRHRPRHRPGVRRLLRAQRDPVRAARSRSRSTSATPRAEWVRRSSTSHRSSASPAAHRERFPTARSSRPTQPGTRSSTGRAASTARCSPGPTSSPRATALRRRRHRRGEDEARRLPLRRGHQRRRRRDPDRQLPPRRTHRDPVGSAAPGHRELPGSTHPRSADHLRQRRRPD